MPMERTTPVFRQSNGVFFRAVEGGDTTKPMDMAGHDELRSFLESNGCVYERTIYDLPNLTEGMDLDPNRLVVATQRIEWLPVFKKHTNAYGRRVDIRRVLPVNESFLKDHITQ